MHILLRWIGSALALYLTTLAASALNARDPALHLRYVFAPGLAGVAGALLFVLALGTANAVLRPLVKMLTLPLTCLTLGLFGFFVNAFFFWLAGQFIPGFRVAGWQFPLFGSVVMSLVGGLLNNVVVSRLESGLKSGSRLGRERRR
jgi:putative membrane protein